MQIYSCDGIGQPYCVFKRNLKCPQCVSSYDKSGPVEWSSKRNFVSLNTSVTTDFVICLGKYYSNELTWLVLSRPTCTWTVAGLTKFNIFRFRYWLSYRDWSGEGQGQRTAARMTVNVTSCVKFMWTKSMRDSRFFPMSRDETLTNQRSTWTINVRNACFILNVKYAYLNVF